MLHSTARNGQKFHVPPASLADAPTPRIKLRLARKVGVICAHCHKRFYPENSYGPAPLYCSRSCQSKAFRARRDAAELAALEVSHE